MAMYRATQEVGLLRHLPRTVNVEHHQLTIICEDNEGAISNANGEKSNKRSRHADIKYHYTRDELKINT